jgi:peptide/nickel transport system permease protein
MPAAAAIALGFLVLVALAVILAPVLAPYGLNQQDYNAINQGPSGAHWLGTDQLGRDVATRLLYGGRVSIESMLVAVVVGAVLGIPLGLVAGYVGRWPDRIIMRVADALLAFPTLVLAIAVTAVLGSGTFRVMLAVGLVIAPSYIRLVRAQVLSVRTRLYVDAARTFGRRPQWIVLRHIGPNSVQPVLVHTTHMLGSVLIIEASLSFLGLGNPPPNPSWGGMLQEAFQNAAGLRVTTIAPGVAIAATLLAVNLVGDRIRDRLDPRTVSRLERSA